MIKRQLEQDLFDENIVGETASDAIDLSGADRVSIQHIYDVNTPDAENFAEADVDVTENTIAITDHGFETGNVGQLTTAGTLPDPFLVLTDYFVIVIDEDTIQLAASLADALAGTPIDIIDDGTGTFTFTPVALAGGSIQVQKSNDGTNWVNESSAATVSADGSAFYEKDKPSFRYIRVVATLTSGQYALNSLILVQSSAI